MCELLAASVCPHPISAALNAQCRPRIRRCGAIFGWERERELPDDDGLRGIYRDRLRNCFRWHKQARVHRDPAEPERERGGRAVCVWFVYTQSACYTQYDYLASTVRVHLCGSSSIAGVCTAHNVLRCQFAYIWPPIRLYALRERGCLTRGVLEKDFSGLQSSPTDSDGLQQTLESTRSNIKRFVHSLPQNQCRWCLPLKRVG